MTTAYQAAIVGDTSHPSRGAWIEIKLGKTSDAGLKGRTPRGVRGLKLEAGEELPAGRSRTPRGVRGLKYVFVLCSIASQASHPSRGAWIEIGHLLCGGGRLPSHPSRGAWIEMICRTAGSR